MCQRLQELLASAESAVSSSSPSAESAASGSPSSAESAASGSPPPLFPSPVDKTSLSAAYGFKDHDWTCPRCRATGSHLDRMIKHHTENHLEDRNTYEAIRLAISRLGTSNRETRARELKQFALEAQIIDAEQPGQQVRLDYYESATSPCVYVVVAGALPLVTCTAPWFSNQAQVYIDIGHQAGREGKEAPRAEDINPKRPKLMEAVLGHCSRTRDETNKQLLGVGRSFGITTVEDGRSNIRNDGLLVILYKAGLFSFPGGSWNSGTNKKDADYLVRVSMQMMEEAGISECCYAGVVDGAAPCIKAANLKQERYFIIAIRCQSHAIALAVKHIVIKCFPSLVQKAEFVVQYIRNHPRLHALLKLQPGGKRSLMRFVETRFLTHVIGMARIKLLKSALLSMLGSSLYATYCSEAAAGDRAKLQKLKEILMDDAFWGTMDFFLAAAEPMAWACRLMDHQCVRAADVTRIWDGLESRLLEILTNAAWSSIDKNLKRDIFQVFASVRKSAHRPIFDAAFVFDPRNMEYMRTLRSSLNQADSDKYRLLLSNTKNILLLVIKRKTYVDFTKRNAPVHLEGASTNKTTAEFDRVVDDAFQRVLLALGHYMTSCDDFLGTSSTPQLDGFWETQCSILASLALVIINAAATVSDVERLHKVFSRIHTSARASLALDKVDLLVTGNYYSKENIIKLSAFTTSLDEFEALDETKLDLLAEWGEMLADATERVHRAIQAPTLTGMPVMASEGTFNSIAVDASGDASARDAAYVAEIGRGIPERIFRTVPENEAASVLEVDAKPNVVLVEERRIEEEDGYEEPFVAVDLASLPAVL